MKLNLLKLKIKQNNNYVSIITLILKNLVIFLQKNYLEEVTVWLIFNCKIKYAIWYKMKFDNGSSHNRNMWFFEW